MKKAAALLSGGLILHGATVGFALSRSLLSKAHWLLQTKRQPPEPADDVAATVLQMYSTCTADTSKFAADVLFEDLAASTSGRAELQAYSHKHTRNAHTLSDCHVAATGGFQSSASAGTHNLAWKLQAQAR